MSIESLLRDLGLPVNTDIDPVERALMEKVKDRIQHVTENYAESELQAEEKWLRGYLKDFFDFSMEWAGKEAIKYKDIKEFDSAPKLKNEAKATLTELQQYVADFSSCYMHISHFMTLLRDEINNEEVRLSSGTANNIKWTADSGIMMERYRKEKKGLLKRMERMGVARTLLEQVESDFIKIKKSLEILFGKDKAEPYTRRFNASIRMTDFRKARKTLKEINEAKKKFGLDKKTAQQNLKTIEASAEKILALTEKEQKTLMSEENKIFLRPMETDLAYNSDIKELHKIKAFLAKYHLPYMQYKLDSLSHLKDKLLVMNSLENLMTLYKRLIMGVARPLKDIKIIRLYESEILNHVKYLLSSHFIELPTILKRAEETVQEFRESRTELEEFSEMDLKEIEVKQDQVA